MAGILNRGIDGRETGINVSAAGACSQANELSITSAFRCLRGSHTVRPRIGHRELGGRLHDVDDIASPLLGNLIKAQGV